VAVAGAKRINDHEIEVLTQAFNIMRKVHKMSNADMGGGVNDKSVGTFTLALMVECAEFLQLWNWKPWKKVDKAFKELDVLDEFADILAFVGVLMTILETKNISPQEIARAYAHKVEVNAQRMLGTY